MSNWRIQVALLGVSFFGCASTSWADEFGAAIRRPHRATHVAAIGNRPYTDPISTRPEANFDGPRSPRQHPARFGNDTTGQTVQDRQANNVGLIARDDLAAREDANNGPHDGEMRSRASELTRGLLTKVGLQEQESSQASGRALPPPTVRSISDSLQSATGKDSGWLLRRGGIVAAVFVALVAVQQVFMPNAKPGLQDGAVQVCGKVRLDAKQFLHLVRVGERMLVLLESPTGMQRLAEITDQDEVERMMSPGFKGSGARAAKSKNREVQPAHFAGHRVAAPATEHVATTASELLEQLRNTENPVL